MILVYRFFFFCLVVVSHVQNRNAETHRCHWTVTMQIFFLVGVCARASN